MTTKKVKKPLTKITSLVDFFTKVKRDTRYRKVAIHAFANVYHRDKPPTYKEAQTWLNTWSSQLNQGETCKAMVCHLNDFLSECQ